MNLLLLFLLQFLMDLKEETARIFLDLGITGNFTDPFIGPFQPLIHT